MRQFLDKIQRSVKSRRELHPEGLCRKKSDEIGHFPASERHFQLLNQDDLRGAKSRALLPITDPEAR